MESFRDWIASVFGAGGIVYYRLIISVMIIVLLVLIRRFLVYLFHRKVENARQRYQYRKATTYILFFIGALIVGGTWLEGFKAFSTFLGLLSAGVAIALKEPLVNLAGWGFLLWRRPFEVGDRIQIGDHRGDVIDLRIFQFSLVEVGNWVDADQSTGRIIHIPNGKVFAETLANYTRGFQFIWDEVPVLITFESNWRKAKDILEVIGKRHAEWFTESAEKELRKAAARYLIFYRKLTPIVYTSVRDSGVVLTIRYLIDPRSRRGVQQAIWEDILESFAKNDDIDFAYPTQRFYNNVMEGKPGARAGGADAPPDKAPPPSPEET